MSLYKKGMNNSLLIIIQGFRTWEVKKIHDFPLLKAQVLVNP